MIEGKATIQKESIAATLLANQQLNLWGIGSALIGLQVRGHAGIFSHRIVLFEPVWVLAGVGSCVAPFPLQDRVRDARVVHTRQIHAVIRAAEGVLSRCIKCWRLAAIWAPAP